MTLKYTNTKAFGVSQDNYVVSNGTKLLTYVALIPGTLYNLPNPHQSNDWCDDTKRVNIKMNL